MIEIFLKAIVMFHGNATISIGFCKIRKETKTVHDSPTCINVFNILQERLSDFDEKRHNKNFQQ